MVESSTKNPSNPSSSKTEKAAAVPVEDDNLIINTSEKLELINSFDELELKEELLRGLYSYGFNKPSAVQKRAILPILRKRDVIVQSQSGTGKTCVFTLGAL